VFLDEESHSVEKVPDSIWLRQRISICFVRLLVDASLESATAPALLT